MARKKSPLPVDLQRGKLSIYILVDGECEQIYLKELKHVEKISAKIKPDLPTRSALEDQYNKVVEALNHYDRVYWVVDYDDINKQHRDKPSNNTLQKFLNLKSKFEQLTGLPEYSGKVAKVLINNPCLEFWYLLHFTATQSYYPTLDQLKPILKQHLKNYEKSADYQNGFYSKLKPKQLTAIANAQRLPRDDNHTTARADIVDLIENDFALLKP